MHFGTLKSMRKTASRFVLLENTIIVYWFLFWLTNGMDKFLNGIDLVHFTWFGHNRISQFSGYFNTINLPEEWVITALHIIGSWEICISVFFLSAGMCAIRQGGKQNLWKISRYGFFLSALTFIVFSVFDVIVGDRFELLEHNVYVGLIILSWFIFAYRRDQRLDSTKTPDA